MQSLKSLLCKQPKPWSWGYILASNIWQTFAEGWKINLFDTFVIWNWSWRHSRRKWSSSNSQHTRVWTGVSNSTKCISSIYWPALWKNTQVKCNYIFIFVDMLPVLTCISQTTIDYLTKRFEPLISVTSVIGETSRSAAARGRTFFPKEPDPAIMWE